MSESQSVEKTCSWGDLYTNVPLPMILLAKTSSFLVGGEK